MGSAGATLVLLSTRARNSQQLASVRVVEVTRRRSVPDDGLVSTLLDPDRNGRVGLPEAWSRRQMAAHWLQSIHFNEPVRGVKRCRHSEAKSGRHYVRGNWYRDFV